MGAKKFALISLSVMLTLASVAIPAHAEDTGAISGSFLDDGVGVANATVFAQGPVTQGTSTDISGSYSFTGLPVGFYRLQFVSQGGMTQWAHGKTEFFQSDEFEVTAGATTVVNEERLDTGLVTGSYVDRQGHPLSNVLVEVRPADHFGFAPSTFTGFDGRFSVAVLPGRYRVEFHTRPQQFPGSGAPFIQYAGGTDTAEGATIFTVEADVTVTVDEVRLPVGSMSGRFTDAAGNGLPNVEVSISRDDQPRGPSSYTDANGYYEFGLMWARSDWRVQFVNHQINLFQYAFGKLRAADADLVTITEGQNTEVSDSRLPTSTVRVRARDAVSGVVVEQFQANMDQGGFAETFTGEAVIDAPVGTHPLYLFAYGYAEDTPRPVTVVEGQETEITVLLQPKTRIETRVVDAVTGEPVAGVCLLAAKPLRFEIGGEECPYFALSSLSGRVMLEIEPGWHQVMAMPVEASGYGAQWVGATAGSGSQLAAKLIEVDDGESAAAPLVRLDRAGVVTGQVRRADGSPAAGAVVSLADWEMFSGGAGLGTATADEDGRYTVDFLGPYEWPLRFIVFDSEADIQWSGGGGNRHLAQRITVQSGQSVDYDFQFRAGTTLKPTVTGATGDCYFFVHNALTGDNIGFHWVETCSAPFELRVAGPQVVKISVVFLDGENYLPHWWGGAGFLTARPVIVPASGSKTLTIGF